MITVRQDCSGVGERIPGLNRVELAELLGALQRTGSEGEDVEAKKAESSLPKSVKDTLSSFSNTRGGILLLGVDEESGFAVTGVTDGPKIAADLGSMCNTDMEPPVRAQIDVVELEDKTLVVAEVPEVEQRIKPCYVKSQGMNRGSFIRVGDADQRLTTYEVQLMMSSSGQPRDDVAPVAGASVADLDSEAVERFVKRLREVRPVAFAQLDLEETLIRSNVAVRTESGVVPTLAGLLSLAKFPQQWFPQLMLTFVSYPTPEGPSADGVRFLDNVALEGSIPVIVGETMAVLRRNMSRRAVVAGAGRKDLWDYPEPALREAIVNALVHRDLSPASFGAQVQVEMYPDRLVIRNPGGLFGPVQVWSLGLETLSSARNSALLRILEEVSLPGEDRSVCENRGSGIRTMLNALREYGMSTPIFKDSISSFSVTFPNHSLLNSETLDWIGSLGERGLSDSQVVALAHLREGKIIDNSGYRTLTGVDSRIATQELQDLVARELTDQQGKSRWATYQLAARLKGSHQLPVRGTKLSPADRRQEILQALGDGEYSRAMLVERTGLSDQVVRHWLKRLRVEGYVEVAGAESLQSKNVKYKSTGKAVADAQQTAFDF